MSATCVMLLLRVDMLVLADRPSKSTGSQQGLEGNKQTFRRGRGYNKSGEGSTLGVERAKNPGATDTSLVWS